MLRLLDTSTFYVVLAIALYLAGKACVIWAIRKKVTRRRTRNWLLAWAILFSPTLSTIAWFINTVDAAYYLFAIPALAVVLDLAILQWTRTFTEPLETLDDLEYNRDITNVDIP